MPIFTITLTLANSNNVFGLILMSTAQFNNSNFFNITPIFGTPIFTFLTNLDNIVDNANNT